MILSCVGKYKKYALLTPLAIMFEVLMEISIPYVMSKIIDIGINNGDMAYVVKMGCLMILMAIFSLTMAITAGRFAAVAAMGFSSNLRKKLFYKLSDFSFHNIDKYSTASLSTRMTTDITNAQQAFMMLIRSAVRSPMMLISATLMATNINSELAATFFVAIPILAVILGTIIRIVHPRFRIMLEKYDKMNSIVQETLIAVRAVKAFVRGDFETEKFEEAADSVRRAQLAAEKIVILNMPAMQFISYACMISVLWFGGNKIIAGSMKTGELISFLTYIMQILMSLMMLSMIFITFVFARASISRINEIFNEVSDINNDDADESLKVKDGSIKFKNVSFSYSKNKNNITLENVSFEINSGETVGILGGTGSSKTTLVQLIPRLYDVLEGEVEVGGNNVKKYTLDHLRDEVAMVLQKNVLFSGSIIDNLRWGDKNASDEEIIKACKDAQAHEFIEKFPDGYNTILGQGGVNLSGGQKQRLCIARALLKKPKIIILDDSTSAVDTATDKKIRDALKTNLAHTTSITIAQRVTSVMEADKIIILDDGKINAIGTHAELLENNEIYRELYNSQQKGVQE